MGYDSLEEIRPGQLIAERYRLEEPIGHGAMGAVWRAVHVRLEAPVAIKLLKSAIADDPEMLERFLREARSAAAVRSSHVVQIFDYGVDRDVPYIAMELLVGEPLDARLDARGVLEPPELDKIFTEIARAVGNAHAQGVVHRDIKPANVFIAREGDLEVTKVLDFGIAKLLDQRLAAPVGSGTHTGNILGTPNYMSPEQARGQRQVDHRSDLWSLAVLAFECLTGRQPFESTTLGDLVVKICTAEPLVPSAVARVPAAFDAWFSRGVSKDPGARFRSALEMADELHALLSAEGLGADSWRRSSTDRRFPPERVERATQRGHSAPLPPGGAAAGGARGAPSDAPFQPARTEPSASTSTGAIATEVLQPVSHGARRRRHLGLAALALGAAGVAFGLGPALFEREPSPDARHGLSSDARPLAPVEGATPATPSTAAALKPAPALPSPAGLGPAETPATEANAPAAIGADATPLEAPEEPGAATPSGEPPPAAPSVTSPASPPARVASGGGAPSSEPAKAAPPAKASKALAAPRPVETKAPSPPTPQAAPAPAVPFDPYSDRL